MYELIKAGSRTFYIECPSKMGIYLLNDTDVLLIDSGSSKDVAKKILKVLDEKGWRLKLLFNTHSHSDHIGGNSYLEEKTGCNIYAPGIEAPFTKYPILEPSFLYGAFPPKELCNKFLMAKPSGAKELTPDVLPEGFEAIPLKGHFFDMTGFRTPDGAVFLADCLFSESIINKYHINYIYDVGEYLKTLDIVENMDAEIFIPSHSSATNDIKSLVRLNRDKILSIMDKILEFCKTPVSTEDLLQKIFYAYDLKMDFNQHALIYGTLKSYLSYLKDLDKISMAFKDNRLFWKNKG